MTYGSILYSDTIYARDSPDYMGNMLACLLFHSVLILLKNFSLTVDVGHTRLQPQRMIGYDSENVT